MDTSTVVSRASRVTDTLGRRIVPRRFRTVTEKQRIVQELIESRCSGAELARRHGVNANLVFTWRRLHEQGLLVEHRRRVRRTAKLLAVQVDSDRPVAPPSASAAYIEVELPGGIRVRSFGAVDRTMLEQVFDLLRR